MTNIPVIVVANKIDLVASKNYVPPPVQQPRPQHHHHHHHHHHHIATSGESANHLSVAGCSNMLALSPLISLNGALTNGSGSHHQQPEIVQIRDRKEISHLVNQLIFFYTLRRSLQNRIAIQHSTPPPPHLTHPHTHPPAEFFEVYSFVALLPFNFLLHV